MRIGVISDTHGDLDCWREAVAGPFANVGMILHAGDILYHGPKNPMAAGYSPPALATAINSSAVPVIIARGNCDSAVDQLVIDFPIQSPYAFVSIEGVNILINHGDELSQPQMAEMAKRVKADIFVFGHIHVPVLEEKEGVVLMNPGSAALPKSPARTVGLIDTDRREAFVVELPSGGVVKQIRF